jgi:hypothetical protein
LSISSALSFLIDFTQLFANCHLPVFCHLPIAIRMRHGLAYNLAMNATDFFTALEQEFNTAVARKDADSLDSRFLAPDFGLHISLQPDQSVPRKDWLATLRIYNVHRWSMRASHVRDFGNLAIINLIINQEVDVQGIDRSGDFFLVDVWTRNTAAGDRWDPLQWRIAARYSSPLRDVGPIPALKG